MAMNYEFNLHKEKMYEAKAEVQFVRKGKEHTETRTIVAKGEDLIDNNYLCKVCSPRSAYILNVPKIIEVLDF